MNKMTFALYFGNRGFFPEKLVAAARQDMQRAVEKQGFDVLMMDKTATQHGAVEGTQEGFCYAKFLAEHRGEFDGVILCLPNFGDETGAIAALRDANVPILIQAYPDEPDKMGFDNRRDAFCGKFSVMDVFHQYGLPFTSFAPHTVHPASEVFAEHLRDFAAVCRIVGGMNRLIVGAVGARTTAFKTVRFDEITLQHYGISTETLDLSSVIAKVRSYDIADAKFAARADLLRKYTNWGATPDDAFETHVKLSLVLDDIIEEFELDTLAIRCWLEMEQELKIAPCVVVSELNDRLITCACEVDVCNAVAMYALRLASDKQATCLDWNNNYGDEADKCILFHCGPVPQSLMVDKGEVVDHPLFAKALGSGCSWGPNVGRIAPTDMTFASCKTEGGKLSFFVGEGEITTDEIAPDFFGCAGVAKIDNLQDLLLGIGQAGYRHHVSMTPGQYQKPIREAFERYLGYEMDL